MADEENSSQDEALKKTDPSPRGQGLPLFYKRPTPLDAKKHADLGLVPNFGLGFTRNVNSVPINMIEMPQICHSYPIAFSKSEHASPVALIGLRDNENLFVDDKGEWEPNTYIPAYIRRYPFIFSEMPESNQLTLCVDMDEQIFHESSEQKLFDQDGKPSKLAKNALEFCKSYHAAALQTNEFGKELRRSDLLVDRQAEVNIGNGKKINFSGFQIVDEKRLAELSDADFVRWRQKGWLPSLYAHLFSAVQWQRLTALLKKRLVD